MKHWRYVQAFCKGTSHFTNNLPCQDRALSKVITDCNGQEIFLASVADGAGSSSHSQYGAEKATTLILQKLEEFFQDGSILTEISQDTVESWVSQISLQILELADSQGINIREYACTLLAIAVTPTEGVFFQIGDGVIVIGAEGNYYPVFWPMNGEYANSTYFITEDHSVKQAQFKIVNNQTIENVALMSDGLQGLALHFATKTAHSPFFQPMFSRLAEESNSGLSEILSTSLEEFLNSEQVCSRTDDDKSLILATCHSIFSNTSEGEEVDSNDAL